MKSITRLVTTVAVMFAVATLSSAQDVKPTDLGKGGGVQRQEDRDEGPGRGRLPPVFHGGKGKSSRPTRTAEENTDVAPFRLRLLRRGSRQGRLARTEVFGKVTPTKDGQYKFVIKNAGGANTVTFNGKGRPNDMTRRLSKKH